jgi:hypothetical protein
MFEEGYEWLAIKGKDFTGAFEDKKYVYIDDVELRTEPYCNNFCTPQLGNIVHSTLPNAVCSNISTASCSTCCKGFGVLIKNAIEVEFSVWNRWGERIFNYFCFDINGLKDPGFTDYLLEWHGENNSGAQLPLGVYHYKLDIKNCQDSKSYTRDITYYPASNLPIVVPPIVVNSIPNCCLEDLHILNMNIYGSFRQDVNNIIKIAGNSPITGQLSPVTVHNGGNLNVVAGNKIIINKGFTVNNGGKFNAYIEGCGIVLPKEQRVDRLLDTFVEEISSKDSPNNIYKEEFNNIDSEKTDRDKEEFNNNTIVMPIYQAESSVNIFPNPAGSSVNIEINGFSGDIILEVYNSFGQLLWESSILNDLTFSLDLEKYASGLYFIKIRSFNLIITRKLTKL